MKTTKKKTSPNDFHLFRAICSYMPGEPSFSLGKSDLIQGRAMSVPHQPQKLTLTGPLAASSPISKYSFSLKLNMLAMMLEGKTCCFMLNFMTASL